MNGIEMEGEEGINELEELKKSFSKLSKEKLELEKDFEKLKYSYSSVVLENRLKSKEEGRKVFEETKKYIDSILEVFRYVCLICENESNMEMDKLRKKLVKNLEILGFK